MKSKSICDARTKRVAWGGTRTSPDSKACSTFALQFSFNPKAICFACSMFKSTTVLAEHGNLTDQLLKLIGGKARAVPGGKRCKCRQQA